jgi:hypothetical protein
MYITELIDKLALYKAQYGDIEVTVKNQLSFQVSLRVIEVIDPETKKPIAKALIAE